MNENTDNQKTGNAHDETALDVTALDFAPDWARKTPRIESSGVSEKKSGVASRDKRTGKRRPPGRGGPGDGSRERRPPAGGAKPVDRFDGSRSVSGRKGKSATSSLSGDSRPAERDRSVPPPDIPVEVRFLPEFKAMGAIVHKIQVTRCAYPLRDMARLFLDNEASCVVRLETGKPDAAGNPPGVFQCRLCGAPALERGEIEGHVLKDHLEDCFERVEERMDPPAGVFNSVIRCGVTGELLGPPNHHSTLERIREILRTVCASIDEDTYRSRLEMCYEEDVIEQWREQARQRVRYRRREERENDAPSSGTETEAQESPPGEGGDDPGNMPDDPRPLLELQQAEFVMLREIAPGLVRSGARITCSLKAAKQTPSDALRATMRDAWHRERKFPASLTYALRGAFRHKKLHVFKANDTHGPEFVVASGFSALDPRHAVPEIRAILEYAAAHPGATLREIVEALRGDVGLECDAAHLQSQIRWLVEKGHLVLYFNGVIALPGPHPFFRNPAENKRKD